MKNERPKLTIGATQDKHAENHSRRLYTPFSADRSLEKYNVVIFDCGDDREHFNAFFQPAIERYNSRQKRADRKKDLDYLSALEDGREGYGKGKSKEQPFYHDVVQIGNRYTNGVTDDDFDVDYWRSLKKEGKLDEASAYVEKHLTHSKINDDVLEIYKEIANEILENLDHKYDGILIHGIIIHCDEPNGTPHMDIRYSFYTEGEKTGLDTRVSQRKALAKLGFHTDREQTALQKFREDFKDRIEVKLIERGYERDVKNEHRKHKSVVAYEMEQRAKEAESKKEKAEKTMDEMRQFFIDKIYDLNTGTFDDEGFYLGNSETIEDFYTELRQTISDYESSVNEEKEESLLIRNEGVSLRNEGEDEMNKAFFLYVDTLKILRPDLFDDDTYLGVSNTAEDFRKEVTDELFKYASRLHKQEQKQQQRKSELEEQEETLQIKKLELDEQREKQQLEKLKLDEQDKLQDEKISELDEREKDLQSKETLIQKVADEIIKLYNTAEDFYLNVQREVGQDWRIQKRKEQELQTSRNRKDEINKLIQSMRDRNNTSKGYEK